VLQGITEQKNQDFGKIYNIEIGIKSEMEQKVKA